VNGDLGQLSAIGVAHAGGERRLEPGADPAHLDRVVDEVVWLRLPHGDRGEAGHDVTSWGIYESFILSIWEHVDRVKPLSEADTKRQAADVGGNWRSPAGNALKPR
jgi:hypothetical protein